MWKSSYGNVYWRDTLYPCNILSCFCHQQFYTKKETYHSIYIERTLKLWWFIYYNSTIIEKEPCVEWSNTMWNKVMQDKNRQLLYIIQWNRIWNCCRGMNTWCIMWTNISCRSFNILKNWCIMHYWNGVYNVFCRENFLSVLPSYAWT